MGRQWGSDGVSKEDALESPVPSTPETETVEAIPPLGMFIVCKNFVARLSLPGNGNEGWV